MRRHDLSHRRQPAHQRFGLALVVAAAIAYAVVAPPTPSWSQSVPGVEPGLLRSQAPIDLTADRVEVWDGAGARWVHLVGQAAALQGVDGIRGREALARLTTTSGEGGPIYRVEVFAEDASSTSQPGARLRATETLLHTRATVRIRSYRADQLITLKEPPRDLGLYRRSPWAARAASSSPVTRSAGYGIPASGPAQEPPRPANPAPQVPTAPPPAAPPVTLPTQAPAATMPPSAPRDPVVLPTQFPGSADPTDDPTMTAPGELPPPLEGSPLDRAPQVPSLDGGPGEGPPSTDLEPLPGPDGGPAPPAAPGQPREPLGPVLPGTQRVTRVSPRNGGPNFLVTRLPLENGVDTMIIRGGVNIVTEAPQFGIIDISADNVIIWRRVGDQGKVSITGPNGEQIDDARIPMEFYLEGNVEVRQDERKVAGNGDQKTYRAQQAYFDVLSERFIGVNAELDMFAPGLVAPARITSPRIEQYRPFQLNPDGTGILGLAEIRADQTMGTGSRFPKPGYRFTSRSVDIFRVPTNETEPNSGRQVGDPGDPNSPQDLTWRIDARRNAFWLGRIPIFFWPRFVAEAEDLEPPLRQITFRTNNYFGQQILSDWNGFRLFGLRKPLNVDMWNLDLDYLSARTTDFPALGSEIGWFGRDLINDLSDPYGKVRGKAPSFTSDYFGYFDIWGLKDTGRDILGSGPAIITNNNAAANVGYQRGGGGPLGAVPPFVDFRGRVLFRHMQRLIPDDEEHLYEDFRVQASIGFTSDRYFLEEYYKRLFDVGMDQETLVYMLRQKQNWAWSIWAEANLQQWYTESQWLPRLDYYRLGDSLLSNWFTYYQHSGVDYANTHTAVEVNNPYIFAFLPYDPISNTSGPLEAFRGYTNHELDMPLKFGNVLRVVPYLQGQAVGWSNQIDGNSLGRIWGAAGARAEMMAWKTYPWAQSEILNVHGLNHKINLEADFRSAYSNQHLDYIGVQDDLDDNTYESVRRYFALTNYAGGLLPPQYDPRHLMLRQTLSPISGPTDIQNSINTLRLGLHQRLQTKRGPEGKRRIMDWMTLDLDTTFFPTPSRDNFGKPFGQNTYNWQWFIGDRTSIISYGWFEFFDITGNPIYKTNIDRHNDPFGLNVITTGISLTRPPRGSLFLGYTVIDTGPLNTSALNVSSTYWLSPKWYGTASTMYDFGNAILLNAMFSITRIGADYLTSIGLTVDPQRQSYMFAFQISPRLSPNVKLGSGVGLNSFDSRFAPME